MRNYKWLFFCLILASLCLGSVIYLLRVAPTAIPVLRLNYGTEDIAVDAVSQIGIPNKGYLHAAVANDQFGTFYILAAKRDISLRVLAVPESVAPKDVAAYGQIQQNVIHVIIAARMGQVNRVVPLRRLDGRLVRGHCEFLAVSASGERWWTLRQAGESPDDWNGRRGGEKRTVLLNAYDNQGKPLAEWEVPLPLAIETFAMAATETEAYIVPEILEQEKQLLIYKLGNSRPQKHSWPGSWHPTIGQSLIITSGQFWHLQPQKKDSFAAYVTELEKPSRLFTTFQLHRKTFYPFLFWQDVQAGLFVFENLRDEKGKIRFADGAKAVYRVAPDGTVHKLFETPDVLQTRRGEEVRAGQLLKADANFVWMEATYLKNGQVTEYQIVKIPIS